MTSASAFKSTSTSQGEVDNEELNHRIIKELELENLELKSELKILSGELRICKRERDYANALLYVSSNDQV
jgi:hypothetical protein